MSLLFKMLSCLPSSLRIQTAVHTAPNGPTRAAHRLLPRATLPLIFLVFLVFDATIANTAPPMLLKRAGPSPATDLCIHCSLCLKCSSRKYVPDSLPHVPQAFAPMSSSVRSVLNHVSSFLLSCSAFSSTALVSISHGGQIIIT